MGVGGLHELELAGSSLLSPSFTSSPKTAEAVFIMSDVELSGPTHDFAVAENVGMFNWSRA